MHRTGTLLFFPSGTGNGAPTSYGWSKKYHGMVSVHDDFAAFVIVVVVCGCCCDCRRRYILLSLLLMALPMCASLYRCSCCWRYQGDIRMSDVQRLTEEEQRAFEEQPTLLAAAQRCNRYVASDFTPVYVEDVKVRMINNNIIKNNNNNIVLLHL